MDFLPDIEKRERLEAELRTLIEMRGATTFATGPVILPTDAFFPDKWTSDAAGVWRLSERVMAYAGLSNLVSVIQIVRKEQMPDENALATFDGLDGDHCRFCVRLDLVEDPVGLAAALAHEAAHAYRAYHGLVTDGPDEELLTDLTVAFLGFGVMGLNASYRYSAKGGLAGGYTVTEYSHRTQGYLAMQDFAYLLALQCTVRAFDSGELRAVEKYLGANQGACFRKALKAMRGKRDSLRSRLGISQTDGQPSVRLSPPVRELRPSVHLLYDAGKEDTVDGRRTANKGLPVFRVSKHHGWFWAGVGAALTFGAIAALWDRFSADLEPAAVLPVILTAAIVSYGIGRARSFDQCSEPECEKRLPPEATICPGCGGTISGRIKRAADRLEAREALEDNRLGNLLKRNRKA